MCRDLLSIRAIQVGFVFFLLCVSSLLYSWHVQRTTEVSEFGVFGIPRQCGDLCLSVASACLCSRCETARLYRTDKTGL